MTQSGPSFIPSFYNDLTETGAEAWRVIGRGAVDRRSPFHTPSVATIGLDGQPQARTVVLRAVDPVARTLRFHTDRRSTKFVELSADARVTVLGYDAGRKIQLRLAGRATLHHGDALATAAWAQSRAMSQACYAQTEAPGTPLTHAGNAPSGTDAGFANFTVVSVQIFELEWLYLAHEGHRRARFAWGTGKLQQTWLAP
jgi:pyridoxamine 5'-phosphate oxidase